MKTEEEINSILDSLGGIKTRKKEVARLRELLSLEDSTPELFVRNDIKLQIPKNHKNFKQYLEKLVEMLDVLINLQNSLDADYGVLQNIKIDLYHVLEFSKKDDVDTIPIALELAHTFKELDRNAEFTKETKALNRTINRIRFHMQSVRNEIHQEVQRYGE